MNTYTTSEAAKITGIHPNTVRLYVFLLLLRRRLPLFVSACPSAFLMGIILKHYFIQANTCRDILRFFGSIRAFSRCRSGVRDRNAQTLCSHAERYFR